MLPRITHMKKSSFRLPVCAVVSITLAVGVYIGLGANCFLKPGENVWYEPSPPCPSGKNGTGMCFKWVIPSGYGLGGCLGGDDGEVACDQGTYTLTCTEWVGMCTVPPNSNCIMASPPISNGTLAITGTFSIASRCFGT